MIAYLSVHPWDRARVSALSSQPRVEAVGTKKLRATAGLISPGRETLPYGAVLGSSSRMSSATGDSTRSGPASPSLTPGSRRRTRGAAAGRAARGEHDQVDVGNLAVSAQISGAMDETGSPNVRTAEAFFAAART